MKRVMVKRPNGTLWSLGPPSRTSDGYLLSTGTLLDPDTREAVEDESGFPVLHSFFLGRAT